MPVNTTVLPATAESRARLLGVADLHLLHKPVDAPDIVRLAEIFAQTFDHRIANLIERIHFLFRLGIVLGELEARIVERLPTAVAARQRHRRGLADMADAERINEALQRDLAARRDGGEQVAHRGLAKAFDLFEMDFLVALLQRENIRRLPDPLLLVEQLDLLLAQPSMSKARRDTKCLRCSIA